MKAITSARMRRLDPDVALMLRVQRDEPGAFADLVCLYQSRIFARVFRCVGDRQEAEDLTQEVFLRLFRNRKRYEPRARFSTWIFHIAQNVARNAIRSHRRHAWLHYRPLDCTEALYPDHCSAPPVDPGRRLDLRELADQLRRAMAHLLTRQREALELQHYHDCSYPEIASVLALTPKAAKSLLYRARMELRKHLETAAS